jgi:hypothetical protein
MIRTPNGKPTNKAVRVTNKSVSHRPLHPRIPRPQATLETPFISCRFKHIRKSIAPSDRLGTRLELVPARKRIEIIDCIGGRMKPSPLLS